MPIPDVFPTVLNMSPDGSVLAVGGGGLQVFHFNGGAPITPFSTVLTTDPVKWIRWDKADHLFGLSTNGKLYVYTISSIIQFVPGSPYTVSGPSGLFVVPR
jgi:WD40 repeat protein